MFRVKRPFGLTRNILRIVTTKYVQKEHLCNPNVAKDELLALYSLNLC